MIDHKKLYLNENNPFYRFSLFESDDVLAEHSRVLFFKKQLIYYVGGKYVTAFDIRDIGIPPSIYEYIKDRYITADDFKILAKFKKIIPCEGGDILLADNIRLHLNEIEKLSEKEQVIISLLGCVSKGIPITHPYFIVEMEWMLYLNSLVNKNDSLGKRIEFQFLDVSYKGKENKEITTSISLLKSKKFKHSLVLNLHVKQ
jgi:hypothetical protein